MSSPLWKKNPDRGLVILPGVGVLRDDAVFEGDDCAAYARIGFLVPAAVAVSVQVAPAVQGDPSGSEPGTVSKPFTDEEWARMGRSEVSHAR